ncbi:MAG: hypothetical protein AB6733_11835 [Clostridiaceae bacterium]
MNIVFFIISTIVSLLVFKTLFSALSDRIRIFGPIQRFANRPDRRKIYKNITFFMIIMGNVYIKDFFRLNYIEFGATLGFLIALYNVVFEYDKK